MKQALTILSAIILTGCSCLAQIPTQYIYGCESPLPSYLNGVTAVDDCGPAVLEQIPEPGIIITTSTVVTITATDQSGNTTGVTFMVELLDTIGPVITIDSAQFAVSDAKVFDMFRTVNAWIYNYPARYLAAIDTGGLTYMDWKKITIPRDPEPPIKLAYADTPMIDTMIREDLQAGRFRYTYLIH